MNLHILKRKRNINILPENFDLSKPLNSSLKSVRSNKKLNSIGVIYKDNAKIYPAISKIWRDNAYSYNKNYSKNMPFNNIYAGNLLKYYFNMYNKNLEKKIFKGRKRHINRFRRTSTNRILISRLESSLTNNSVLLNVFAFNPEKYFLMKHLIKSKFKLTKKVRSNQIDINKKNKKLKLIQKINFSKKINYLKNIFDLNLKVTGLNPERVNNYMFALIRKRVKKLLYKYLLFINQSKFNSIFLSKLIPFLGKIYDKKVNLNIINLKYFHMNNEFTSKLFMMKLRKREVSLRRLILKLKVYLRKKFLRVKLKTGNIYGIKFLVIKNTKNNIVVLRSNKNVSLKENYFSNLLTHIYSTKKKTFLKNVQFKYIRGIMLKINGRLTKRFTAARAVRTLYNKGGVKNIYSQRKNMSSTLTKGYLAPNVQYTNMKYKTRIGAFGIKGWLGSV